MGPMNLDVPYPGRSGGSATQGKAVAAEWIRELDPRCVLDVGAGQGVWSQIVKQVIQSCKMIAVEIFFPSIAQYELRSRYNEIIVADVRWLDWAKVVNEFSIDLVILGDVLEHMPATDAMRVIDEVTFRRLPALVSLPVHHWPQGEVDGNPYEAHVYHWTDERFRTMFEPRKAHLEGPLGVYLVQR